MNKRSIIILLGISVAVITALFFTMIHSYKKQQSASTSNEKKNVFSISDDEIGILEINGVIIESEEVLKKIRVLKKRDSIKSVIVRIDSPGGSSSASQEIYEELKKLDQVKPVIASFSSVAASGGYYIGCAARVIIANPATITGSIGVISKLANLEKLYEFIKVSPFIVKSGKYKDLGSPLRKITPEEIDLLQKLSDNIHLQFKKAVSESRKIPLKALDNIADGRVFTGEQAFQYGLVDDLGTFDDAIRYASSLSGLGDDPTLFYPKDKRESLRDLFGSFKSMVLQSFNSVDTNIPSFF